MPPTKHAKLGPSSAERWLNCTPSANLTEKMPEEPSEYAESGQLSHAIGELKLRKKFTTLKPSKYKTDIAKLQANPLYEKGMESRTDEYVDAVTEIANGFPELPYVALEQQVDFSEWVPGGFGTCDCLLIGSFILHIVDYKDGSGVPVEAEDNPQMKMYALGAWAWYSLIYPITTIRWTIVQPRLGGVSATQEMTLDDLLEWANTYVKPRAILADAGQGEYKPGPWCRFCKARATCRVRSDYNLDLEGFQAAPPPLLTDTELGQILTRGADLKAWLSDVQEYALRYLLDGGTVPGWKAVEGRAVRAWTDQDKAFKAVMAAGTPEAMLYTREPLSLSKVEELLGKKAFKAFTEFVTVPPGKPTLAVESDRREAITNRTDAEEDFKPEAQDPQQPTQSNLPAVDPGLGDPYNQQGQ